MYVTTWVGYNLIEQPILFYTSVHTLIKQPDYIAKTFMPWPVNSTLFLSTNVLHEHIIWSIIGYEHCMQHSIIR